MPCLQACLLYTSKGVIPAGIWGHDEGAPVPQTDLDGARALLTEEGVADTGLELVMTYATGDALESVAAELWKANLETLGITLTLQPMNWEAQWQLAKSDPAAAQDIFVTVSYTHLDVYKRQLSDAE